MEIYLRSTYYYYPSERHVSISNSTLSHPHVYSKKDLHWYAKMVRGDMNK